jgi:TPR repeat protein
LRKAAADNHAPSLYALGEAHFTGKEGYSHSTSKAVHFFQLADRLGHAPATQRLEELLQAAGLPDLKMASAPLLPSSPSNGEDDVQNRSLSLEGSEVELFGLLAKPELNGRKGIVSALNGLTGRYVVLLDDGTGPFNLKPENVRAHEESPDEF